MEVVQWHQEEVPESDKILEQPDYDKVDNQVTDFIELNVGDLVRIYCGMYDPEHPESPDEVERKNPFGVPLRIKEFDTEDGVPVIITEAVKDFPKKRRLRLDDLGVVENPASGYHPYNALQILEKNNGGE
jgi:hypothetical protein